MQRKMGKMLGGLSWSTTEDKARHHHPPQRQRKAREKKRERTHEKQSRGLVLVSPMSTVTTPPTYTPVPGFSSGPVYGVCGERLCGHYVFLGGGGSLLNATGAIATY